MDREIKFRGWKHRQNEMISWEQIKHNSGSNLSYGHWDLFIRQDLMKPLQFTGLKDRNGKDWYEGDLVRINDTTPIHETIWSEKDMGWKIKLVGFESTFNINAPLFEIIGNIYENPTLLDQNPTVF